MEKYDNCNDWVYLRRHEINLLKRNLYPENKKLQNLLDIISFSKRFRNFYFLYFVAGTSIKFNNIKGIPSKIQIQKEIDDFWEEQKQLGYS
jgi:hypothetical protein